MPASLPPLQAGVFRWFRKNSAGAEPRRAWINDGSDDKTRKAEGQRRQSKPFTELADRTVWPHHGQQVKAQNGRWQHKWECHDSIDGASPPAIRMGQFPRKGCPENEEDGGRQCCQLQSQPDSRKIHFQHFQLSINGRNRRISIPCTIRRI